jgi:protein-S-isoprenylcysteine O-methyltransferase Ste14
MAHILILLAGSSFLAVLLFKGWCLRLAGYDVKGRPPVSRPVFLAGKTAMGLLWGLTLWRAAAAVRMPGEPVTWLQYSGTILFVAGSSVALISFAALGRELRFGLPNGNCRLKAGGIYSWSRHPMYTGFFLMAGGAALYVGTPLAVVCLLVAVGIHHRVALAEERFMARHFGVAWQAYTENVPRYGGLIYTLLKRSEQGHDQRHWS